MPARRDFAISWKMTVVWNIEEIAEQEKEIQKLKMEYEEMQAQFENKINTYATCNFNQNILKSFIWWAGNEELNRVTFIMFSSIDSI